jgi:hypothetical protein
MMFALLASGIFLCYSAAHTIPDSHFNLSSYKTRCPNPSAFDSNPYADFFVNDIIVTRYKPGSDAYSQRDESCAPHRFLKMFDWTIYFEAKFLSFKTENPQTVFIFGSHTMENINMLVKFLPQLEPGQKRSLLIGGADVGLRHYTEWPVFGTLIEPDKFFTQVWIESKNIKHDRINTFPMGLRVEYITLAGWENVGRAISLAQVAPHPRPYFINAAWGKRFPQLDNQLGPRKALIQALNEWKWVNRSMWDYDEYWSNVGQYKFSICPAGAGVQSPKIFECLMLQSIPVLTALPAFVDLKNLGFPLVLVKRWIYLTPELLEEEYNKMKESLNWTRVREMLRPEHAMQLIETGSYDFLK